MATFVYRYCKHCDEDELQSVDKSSKTYNCKFCGKENNTHEFTNSQQSAALIDPYSLGRIKADPLFREYLGAIGCKNVN